MLTPFPSPEHVRRRRRPFDDVRTPPVPTRCSSCAMRHLCVPQGLPVDTLSRLETVISFARPVLRGEALYRSGDPFLYLYAVRSGALKTVMTHRDGREQVTGLRLAGDAIGLDGLNGDTHTSSAVALEDSSVCIIPYAALIELCREVDTMQARLFKLAGEAIVRVETHMMVNGSLSAEERVAGFLLDISERNAQRGYSPAEFNVRMTRDEMGSYLGLTLETVSRVLSRFQKRRLIDAQGKLIRIMDPDSLRAI